MARRGRSNSRSVESWMVWILGSIIFAEMALFASSVNTQVHMIRVDLIPYTLPMNSHGNFLRKNKYISFSNMVMNIANIQTGGLHDQS